MYSFLSVLSTACLAPSSSPRITTSCYQPQSMEHLIPQMDIVEVRASLSSIRTRRNESWRRDTRIERKLTRFVSLSRFLFLPVPYQVSSYQTLHPHFPEIRFSSSSFLFILRSQTLSPRSPFSPSSSRSNSTSHEALSLALLSTGAIYKAWLFHNSAMNSLFDSDSSLSDSSLAQYQKYKNLAEVSRTSLGFAFARL